MANARLALKIGRDRVQLLRIDRGADKRRNDLQQIVSMLDNFHVGDRIFGAFQPLHQPVAHCGNECDVTASLK